MRYCDGLLQVYEAYLDLDQIEDPDLLDFLTEEFIESKEDTDWFEAFEIVGFHTAPPDGITDSLYQRGALS